MTILYLAGVILGGFGVGVLLDLAIRGPLQPSRSLKHLDHAHLANVQRMHIVSKANHATLAKALADICEGQIGGRVGLKNKGSDHGPRY